MLLSLPDEILLAIIGMTRPTAQWLACAGATCHRFASLCRDDSLWRTIAVDTLDQAAVGALSADSHKALLRFMHTATVHIVIQDSNSFRDKQRVPQATLRLNSVATPRALSKVVCAFSMCPPHKAHVWARQRDATKSPTPYRLITAPLVSAAWPSERPWWASAFDRSVVEGETCARLAIDAKATAHPAAFCDSRSLLHVPQCVVNETSFDLGLASPHTWYNKDRGQSPAFSLTHVVGCACNAK
nr:F-box domain containing protein [Pandoravirus aubagnensis]